VVALKALAVCAGAYRGPQPFSSMDSTPAASRRGGAVLGFVQLACLVILFKRF
jgi:hypothetical protein